MTPSGLVFDGQHNQILVTELGDGSTPTTALFEVNPTTGNRTVLSNFNRGSGPNLLAPQYIDLVPGGRQAMVTDNYGRLLRVDLENGNRVLVADDSLGSGESLLNLKQIAVGANGLIYAVGTNFKALFAIDPLSGDRVIISK